MITRLPHFPGRALALFSEDRSGLALLEFALILPVFLTMALTGAEMTNYITTKMRISQLALHIADDAARMGSGSQLASKTINEADINDLFTGAQMQSGELDLQTNGRVILTDLEPTSNPNTAGTYKIGWRRCYGAKTSYTRQYPPGNGTTSLTGIGPAGRQVTAQDDNATMFVEVFYTYVPLVGRGTLAPTTTFTEFASMAVRDRRDLTQVYPSTGVTASTCPN
ncbi:MAG: pilus assembly protein [Candidatus Sphingomonas phytovorans]|nr:TadE/TadG family type IV pilus assembly protein [Sphingomonas sp.]WEK01086.1 MAG: pilus assembly protein [Sphingomonas sp.]